MNVLGLSVFSDASAALVSGGEIVCAVEEERLNRIKHYEGMPWLAIEECLRISGWTLRDIDAVAVGWNPLLGWGRRVLYSLRDSIARPSALQAKLDRGGNYLHGIRGILQLRAGLSQRYGSPVPRIHYVAHHVAHAASAYFSSPYERATVVVADGVGEAATFTVFRGEADGLRPGMRVLYPHSLGHLYASVTGFLGFRPTSDEGKVMALASYGSDRYNAVFSDLCRVDPGRGTFRLDTALLDYHAVRRGQFGSEWRQRTKLEPRRSDEPLNAAHEDLASSLQACVERTVFSLLRNGSQRNGSERPLCAAGGLFLNSVLNGRLARELAPEMSVQRAAGDNGVSLGAALYVSARDRGAFRRHPMRHAFLGTGYDDADLRRALDRDGGAYTCEKDMNETLAQEIAEGRIVAHFSGRMEFGPRALGHRSILASPVPPGMKDALNARVKHREAFRPFAAAVLLEDVDEYFEDATESPYMLRVFYFRKGVGERFPAIRHVDGSCRVQTVTAEGNPRLHALLVRLRRRTGHGIVLNTSLNVAGEPIVRTPGEAIRLFRTTEVDTLALGPYLLRKE